MRVEKKLTEVLVHLTFDEAREIRDNIESDEAVELSSLVGDVLEDYEGEEDGLPFNEDELPDLYRDDPEDDDL